MGDIKNTLYPNAIKLTSIDFLNSSHECEFVEYLARLDINNNTLKKSEEDLIKKLFLHTLNEDKIDYDKPLVLKNKYLYLYAEGAMYYLQAIQSMHSEKDKLADLEIEELGKILHEISNYQERITLVSLGSANAEKEITAINKFIKDVGCEKPIHFIPIDVSAPLIQLAVLKFNHELHECQNVFIEPIIADFWDIATVPQYFDFFRSPDTQKNIFTLFGSTIGNYKEKELLKQITLFMKDGDYLVLGLDLIPDNDLDKSKTKIYDQYNTIGNIQFMLNPLSHIPKYRGYVSSFNKYFKLNKDEAVISGSGPQYSLLTDVPFSLCYAPKLEIPLSGPPNRRSPKKMTISMAQSTKYKFSAFQKWIKDLKNKYSIPIKEIRFNHSEEDHKCVMVLQKELPVTESERPRRPLKT